MMSLLFFVLGLTWLTSAAPIESRSGTSTEEITYILPIWEGSLASHGSSTGLAVLSNMKTSLGLGGTFTKLGWADCCTPNSSGGWGDGLLDFLASQPSTTMLSNSGGTEYAHNFGSNYFTLSRLNTVYRQYKKRNVQASASILASFAASNPSLFVGVSLDSETIYPNSGADYNPLSINELKQWLQNTGIYGPGGEYFGAGRVPSFPDIGSFNIATGQNFASWDAMQPPTTITPGDLFSEEWERWRVTMIIHSVSDETLWIASAGIDRTHVYGHQTPRLDDYNFADDIQTATAANGASGVTYYGWVPATFGSVDNPMRGSGKNNFGPFEVNPLSNDPTFSYNTLLTLYNDGIKIICPNAWESDQPSPDQYSLFNSPKFGDIFGNAIKQFLSDHGNSQRNLAPPPWNPGNRVYDFYDSFSTATSTGPDNHLEAAGFVGDIVRKSVYSAVGGVITYTVPLPSVPAGQRLNFWTSLGIKDGAGVGGETQFQVTVNGNALFGTNYHFNKNYWVWKRWVPMMVDVTPWAGSTVTFQFLTTGNDVWGWDPSFITDGNVDGGVNGRNGWSSISHSSASATEWAIVDLGSSQSIGKVVLFSRSDLVDLTGTGFPTGFQIQGSQDSNTWTTLVNESNYPEAKAGEGQIFTFPQTSARYVRILGTTLGGVGSESGYRIQLGEVEIFA